MRFNEARGDGGRPRKDYSKTPGNATSVLQAAYGNLMSIQDPEELKLAMIDTIKPLVGKGISRDKFERFNKIARGCDNLTKLRYYVSNFILKGSGLGVVESKAAAVASFLAEDADVIARLPKSAWRLKAIAESYGYHVCLLDRSIMG